MLCEPFRADVRVGVRGEDELLRSRAVRRVDGIVPVLRFVDGRGLLCEYRDIWVHVRRGVWRSRAESMRERIVCVRVWVCEFWVLGVLRGSVWRGLRGGVRWEGELLGARAVRRGVWPVHLLQRVGRGELLGACGEPWRLRGGRGVRGRWPWAVHQRDVLVRCRVRWGAVRAVLGEPIRVGVRVGVRGEEELFGSRAM